MRKKLPSFPSSFLCLALFSTALRAETVVSSFDDLKNELDTSANADVVLNMSGVAGSVSGNVNIKDGQTVDIKNIENWKNPDHTNDNKPRMMQNDGVLSLDNVNVKGNNLLVASGSSNGGAVIYNTGVIESISNSLFDNNIVDTVQGADIWGGLIDNRAGGNIKKIVDSEFSNNSFYTKQSAPHGAVIYNDSATIELIDNVIFENNVMVANNDYYKGGEHGTVIDNNQYGIVKKITNSKFLNNRAYRPSEVPSEGHASGGAIDNYNMIEEISYSTFEGNNTETEATNLPAMGGAIKNLYMYSYRNKGVIGIIKKIDNVYFTKNFVKAKKGNAYGGAISSNVGEVVGRSPQGGGVIDNIIDSDFTGNYALANEGEAQGGAIHNKYIYTETVKNDKLGYIGIKDTNFTNNYVSGKLDTTDGGAIWSSGTIEFEGENYFSGNYKVVNGTKYSNDIYNAGTINLKDGALVDITGGITGSSGIINLGEGASLNINNTEVSGNKIVMADNASLVLEINGLETSSNEQSGGMVNGDITLNGTNVLGVNTTFDWADVSGEADYLFAGNVDATNGQWDIKLSENGLYDVEVSLNSDNNKLSFNASLKDLDNIADDLNLTDNEALQLNEIVQKTSDNEIFENIRKGLSEKVQNLSKNVGEILKDIADKPEVNFEVLRNNGVMIANAVRNRLYERINNAYSGLASGDNADKSNNVWASMLYQTAKDDGNLDFEADSNAFVMGFDSNINPNLVAGLGYSYINSDVDAGNKNIDIDTHSLFAYGEYSKDNWFYNMYAMYGMSDSKQNKFVLGNNVKGDYDSQIFGLHLMAGLDFDAKIKSHELEVRPNFGVRYYNINQDKYKDNAGIVYDGVENDIVTGVIGLEVSSDMTVRDFNINQRGYINATYDISNNGDNMFMKLPNGGGYNITDEEGDDFGVEFGYGVEAQVTDNVKVGLNYELGVKGDYTSHSGMLNLRYEF